MDNVHSCFVVETPLNVPTAIKFVVECAHSTFVSSVPTIRRGLQHALLPALCHFRAEIQEGLVSPLDFTLMVAASCADDPRRKFASCRFWYTETKMIGVIVIYSVYDATMLSGLLDTFASIMQTKDVQTLTQLLDSWFARNMTARSNNELAKFWCVEDFLSYPSIVSSDLDLIENLGGNNLQPLLETLDTMGLLMLYSACLCERRILFVSQSLTTLTSCMMATLELLYPLCWPHVFVPLLNRRQLQHVCAPSPYMIGLLPEQLADILAHFDSVLGDVIVVWLDCGVVGSCARSPALPDISGIHNDNSGVKGTRKCWIPRITSLQGGGIEKNWSASSDRSNTSNKQFRQIRTKSISAAIHRLAMVLTDIPQSYRSDALRITQRAKSFYHALCAEPADPDSTEHSQSFDDQDLLSGHSQTECKVDSSLPGEWTIDDDDIASAFQSSGSSSPSCDEQSRLPSSSASSAHKYKNDDTTQFFENFSNAAVHVQHLLYRDRPETGAGPNNNRFQKTFRAGKLLRYKFATSGFAHAFAQEFRSNGSSENGKKVPTNHTSRSVHATLRDGESCGTRLYREISNIYDKSKDGWHSGLMVEIRAALNAFIAVLYGSVSAFLIFSQNGSSEVSAESPSDGFDNAHVRIDEDRFLQHVTQPHLLALLKESLCSQMLLEFAVLEREREREWSKACEDMESESDVVPWAPTQWDIVMQRISTNTHELGICTNRQQVFQLRGSNIRSYPERLSFGEIMRFDASQSRHLVGCQYQLRHQSTLRALKSIQNESLVRSLLLLWVGCKQEWGVNHVYAVAKGGIAKLQTVAQCPRGAQVYCTSPDTLLTCSVARISHERSLCHLILYAIMKAVSSHEVGRGRSITADVAQFALSACVMNHTRSAVLGALAAMLLRGLQQAASHDETHSTVDMTHSVCVFARAWDPDTSIMMIRTMQVLTVLSTCGSDATKSACRQLLPLLRCFQVLSVRSWLSVIDWMTQGHCSLLTKDIFTYIDYSISMLRNKNQLHSVSISETWADVIGLSNSSSAMQATVLQGNLISHLNACFHQTHGVSQVEIFYSTRSAIASICTDDLLLQFSTYCRNGIRKSTPHTATPFAHSITVSLYSARICRQLLRASKADTVVSYPEIGWPSPQRLSRASEYPTRWENLSATNSASAALSVPLDKFHTNLSTELPKAGVNYAKTSHFSNWCSVYLTNKHIYVKACSPHHRDSSSFDLLALKKKLSSTQNVPSTQSQNETLDLLAPSMTSQEPESDLLSISSSQQQNVSSMERNSTSFTSDRDFDTIWLSDTKSMNSSVSQATATSDGQPSARTILRKPAPSIPAAASLKSQNRTKLQRPSGISQSTQRRAPSPPKLKPRLLKPPPVPTRTTSNRSLSQRQAVHETQTITNVSDDDLLASKNPSMYSNDTDLLS